MEGLIRKGFTMKLHEGQAAEYARLHALLWPEMNEMIHEFGGHNYSIFLDPRTHRAGGRGEVDGLRRDGDLPQMVGLHGGHHGRQSGQQPRLL